MDTVLPLTTCVAKGDREGFKIHIENNSDVNEGNWVGATPLMLAIQYNRVTMAKVSRYDSLVILNSFFRFLLPVTLSMFEIDCALWAQYAS